MLRNIHEQKEVIKVVIATDQSNRSLEVVKEQRIDVTKIPGKLLICIVVEIHRAIVCVWSRRNQYICIEGDIR